MSSSEGTLTPGRAVYEAVKASGYGLIPWETLRPERRQVWEGIASAGIDVWAASFTGT